MIGDSKAVSGLVGGARKGSAPGLNESDSRGYTAYHHAAANGHLACVKALIRAGADTTLPDGRGATGWVLARQGSSEQHRGVCALLAKLAARGRPAGLVLEERLLRLEEREATAQQAAVAALSTAQRDLEAALDSPTGTPRAAAGGDVEQVALELLDEATAAVMRHDGAAARGKFMMAVSELETALRQDKSMPQKRRHKLEAMAASCREKASMFA